MLQNHSWHIQCILLANVNSRSRSLYAISRPSVVCCLSVCLSVTLVHPTQAVELFGNFFHHTIAQGLYFSGATIRWWGTPLSPWNLRSTWPTPFKTAQFRPISAHSAWTVISSEKSSISTYRKSTTRFPTSHRWTVYVTPKSPKGWHKNAISLFVPVKFIFSRKMSATKFLCMKTSSDIVVATSFPYPTVHRSIAGDVPIYLKLAFKHPFRIRRFPKLSFKSAIGLGAFWSCFSPYDTLAIHWHPQKILRRSSPGNSSVGVFKRKGGSDI